MEGLRCLGCHFCCHCGDSAGGVGFFSVLLPCDLGLDVGNNSTFLSGLGLSREMLSMKASVAKELTLKCVQVWQRMCTNRLSDEGEETLGQFIEEGDDLVLDGSGKASDIKLDKKALVLSDLAFQVISLFDSELLDLLLEINSSS